MLPSASESLLGAPALAPGAAAPALTLKAVTAGVVVGTLNAFLLLYYGLKTGVFPALNLSAGLGSYLLCRTSVRLFGGTFTEQENAVAQTAATATASLAALGFNSGLLAMSIKSYEVTGGARLEGNAVGPGNTAELTFPTCVMWCVAVGLFGSFVAWPLKDSMIVRQRLTYPSGTCAALIIRSLHETSGEAASNGRTSLRAFGLAYALQMYLWCFEGIQSWPVFGLSAAEFGWTFDWDVSQPALGIMLGGRVNYSILLGAVLAYGVFTPYLVQVRSGDCEAWIGGSDEACPYWFDDEAAPSVYVGSFGYIVFTGLGIMLADGCYSICELVRMLAHEATSKATRPAGPEPSAATKALDRLFLDDRALPAWTSPMGYLAFGAGCVAIMQLAFQVQWYQTVTAIAIIPVFAVAIMQAVGLADWNMCASFGKLLMFAFGAWNRSSGEIIPSLALCMVTIGGCGAAADLMSDFKTGYMVGAKPSQMFYAQLIGASFGCVIVPACFAVLNAAFEIPSLDGPLKAVFAPIYRVLAVVTTTGGGELPRHIFAWMFAGAALALALSVANALLEARGWRETHPALTSLVPLPMCVGIGMLIPAASSMEMALGGLVAAWLERRSPSLASRRPFVAAGLLAGGGLAALTQVIIKLAGGTPPMVVHFGAFQKPVML